MELKKEYRKDFCFSTLALGERYRRMVCEMASDLLKYAPGVYFVVLADTGEEFVNYPNVLYRKHEQVGPRFCFNDKRFVLMEALQHFETVVFIDADTRLLKELPDLDFKPGIQGILRNSMFENDDPTLLPGLNFNKAPAYQKLLRRCAEKLKVDALDLKFIPEELFSITRDQGKEWKFLRNWDIFAPRFELRGHYVAEGNIIGLSAASVAWSVKDDQIMELQKVLGHIRDHKEDVDKKIPYFGYSPMQKILSLSYLKYRFVRGLRIAKRSLRVLGHYIKDYSQY